MEKHGLENGRQKMKKKWSKEEDARLEQLCQEGKAVKEIGAELGRSIMSIHNRKCRLSFLTRKDKIIAMRKSPEVAAKIKEYTDQNLYIEDMAILMECPIDTIRYVARSSGFPIKHKPKPKEATQRWTKFSHETVELIRRMSEKERAGLQEIAEKTGLSQRQIYGICNYHEILSPCERRNWSQEEADNMVKMLDNGCSVAVIARELRRSEASVVSKCYCMKISEKYKIIAEQRRKTEYGKMTLEKAIKQKLAVAKNRADEIEISFEITLDQVVNLYKSQNGKCYYTGADLGFIPHTSNTLSIDRVDSSKGYTLDNVVICLWTVNRMKQDISMSDFISVCKTIANRW